MAHRSFQGSDGRTGLRDVCQRIRQGRRPGHAFAINRNRQLAARCWPQMRGRILPRPMTMRHCTSTSTVSASPPPRSLTAPGVGHAAPYSGGTRLGEYFRGEIDHVRIYNRSLSAAEIQTDMATPVSAEVTTERQPDFTAPADGASCPAPSRSLSTQPTSQRWRRGVLTGRGVLGAEDTTASYGVSWNTGPRPTGRTRSARPRMMPPVIRIQQRGGDRESPATIDHPQPAIRRDHQRDNGRRSATRRRATSPRPITSTSGSTPATRSWTSASMALINLPMSLPDRTR